MLKSIGLYTGARIINGATAIAILSLLTNVLSPESYGAYILLFTFSLSLSTISYQWISVSVFRINNPQSKERAQIQTEAISLWLYTSIPVILFAPLIFYIFLPDLISLPIATIMVTLTVLAGLNDLCLNFATSSAEPIRYSTITTGRSVLTIGLVGVFLYIGYREVGALLAVTIGYLSTSFLALYTLDKRRCRNSYVRKQIIRYGLPLSISSIAIIVIDFSDRYMLGIFSSLSEVGYYSAAYNFSQQTTGALLSVLFITVFPRISSAYERERHMEVTKHATTLLVLMVGIGGGIVTSFIWYGSFISSVVIGETIAKDAATLMPIVSFSIVIGVLKSSVFDIPAKLKRQTTYLLAVSLTMAISNIILNLILIPKHGGLGAAYATLLTFTIGMFISLLRDFGFWLKHPFLLSLIKVCAALSIMNIMNFFISVYPQIYWMIGLVVTLIVYAVALYLMAPIESEKVEPTRSN